MPSLIHVVGARPNLSMAAPVIAALGDRGVDQQLLHTRQHDDPRLNNVLLQKLHLPAGPGSGTAVMGSLA